MSKQKQRGTNGNKWIDDHSKKLDKEAERRKRLPPDERQKLEDDEELSDIYAIDNKGHVEIARQLFEIKKLLRDVVQQFPKKT